MNPIAILCSDLHLSHNPPVARSVENWYKAQQHPLDEMRNLADQLGVPIVCAGDLTDKPVQPPEFWCWAMDHLPFMYCVVGQHDLWNHKIDSIQRTTYGALVKAGVIENIGHDRLMIREQNLNLFGFPWGCSFHHPGEWMDTGIFNLAVVHHYVWKDNKHPGARDEDCVDSILTQLSGFDAIVTGDNHSSFIHKNLINCGTFMRRKADERHLKPMIGILYENGNIEPHYLDCTQDKFLDDESLVNQAEELQTDLSGFIQGLRELGVDSLDFRQAVKHKMDSLGTANDVRDLVMETLQ